MKISPPAGHSLLVVLALHAGCSGTSGRNPAPLSPGDVNLIFVVSQDLAFHTPGDLGPRTANLTAKGLQRTLLPGTFLQEQVLAGNNVEERVRQVQRSPLARADVVVVGPVPLGMRLRVRTTYRVSLLLATAGTTAPFTPPLTVMVAGDGGAQERPTRGAGRAG
jgi:hypothetical protein